MPAIPVRLDRAHNSAAEVVDVLGEIDMRCAGDVVLELIDAVNENRAYLSELDGAIGDGDHGVNMSKGFSQCRARLLGAAETPGLAEAFEVLATALLEGVGGAMGPLYGAFFMSWSETLSRHERLDAALFGRALDEAVNSVQAVGDANVGDKTLLDALAPARHAYAAALAAGRTFDTALALMAQAAEQGRDATRDLQARVGRASRLGPRSIGALDPGAASACLLLQTLGASLRRRLTPVPGGKTTQDRHVVFRID